MNRFNGSVYLHKFNSAWGYENKWMRVYKFGRTGNMDPSVRVKGYRKLEQIKETFLNIDVYNDIDCERFVLNKMKEHHDIITETEISSSGEYFLCKTEKTEKNIKNIINNFIKIYKNSEENSIKIQKQITEKREEAEKNAVQQEEEKKEEKEKINDIKTNIEYRKINGNNYKIQFYKNIGLGPNGEKRKFYSNNTIEEAIRYAIKNDINSFQRGGSRQSSQYNFNKPNVSIEKSEKRINEKINRVRNKEIIYDTNSRYTFVIIKKEN
jgi:hypothetical protein